MDLPDQIGQPGVPDGLRRGRPILPGVVAGHRHLQDAEGSLDRDAFARHAHTPHYRRHTHEEIIRGLRRSIACELFKILTSQKTTTHDLLAST
ncbi:hypothetical protein [Nonomuraea fuscirosea]|uniref:hypothetical protein n=1 Tax=Nonomuraea fuscirosea TaxID=1291556 RepID=UPI000D055080|nr:hypothetical protein [Nonomuraea fuscirosea]